MRFVRLSAGEGRVNPTDETMGRGLRECGLRHRGAACVPVRERTVVARGVTGAGGVA